MPKNIKQFVTCDQDPNAKIPGKAKYDRPEPAGGQLDRSKPKKDPLDTDVPGSKPYVIGDPKNKYMTA